jgi:hypothetical protein
MDLSYYRCGAAREHLEELLASRTYEHQSDFVRRYVFQGRAEGEVVGEVTALLTVLAARGPDVRARITACTDTDTTWIGRAVTADTIEDVFG